MLKKVNNEYESLQTEIDKLFRETSKHKIYRKNQEMRTSEEYKTAMKKIGKLVMRLEKIEDENRKNKRHKINT